MSDPQHGDAVDTTPAPEATSGVDEVVESANEALAEAEAASRDAVSDESGAVPMAVEAEAPMAAEAWDAEFSASAGADDRDGSDSAPLAGTADREPAGGSDAGAAARDEAPQTSPTQAASTQDAANQDDAAVTPASQVSADAALTPTVALDDVKGSDSATVPLDDATAAASTPQPIFVQAPEAPRPRGNRGAAGAVGLLAAASFGILYLGASLAFGAIAGTTTTATVGSDVLAALSSWWFWVPVAVFFVAFWLLGAIINRGRWGYWVVFGLLVGIASYGGHLLGQMFQAPFWQLTARQGADLVEGQLLAPLAIVALVIGRELTIWFGAWIAARGKRITELNTVAQREYERTLEAGPQLQRM